MNKRQKTVAFEREKARIEEIIYDIRARNATGSFEEDMWFDNGFDDILDANKLKTEKDFDSGHPLQDDRLYEAYLDGIAEARQFELEEPNWKGILLNKALRQETVERLTSPSGFKYVPFFELPPEERQQYFLEKNWDEAISFNYPQKKRGGQVNRIGRMK